MALTQISTQGIKDGTISSADLADQSVTLAKLPHGTSSNDGKFLRANNGADPTFETVSSIGGGTGVDFDDDVKARFGTGNDLEIYHSSSVNYIQTHNNSNLEIKHGSDVGIKSIADGAVEIYHDGSKKFHTFSEGVTLFGDVFFDNPINAGKDLEWDASQDRLEFKDDVSAVFGASADLQIYHSSNESRIQNTSDKPLKIINGGNAGMLIQNQNSFDLEIKTNAEDAIKCIANAGVELYHDNSKKFETTSSGAQIFGNLNVGTDAGAIFLTNPDGFSPKLQENAGSLEFSTNNNKRMTLGSSGNLEFVDSSRITMGNSADFQLLHNGSNSFIVNSTGFLDLQADAFRILTTGSETQAKFTANGSVELYYDNSKKLSTINEGVEIKGGLYPETNNLRDLGSTSKRWRNIYTNDLNLSNEGGSNDVDGTWGSYTIQEGAEDLFLVNKRNGKKYKFNLAEVS